MFGIKGCHKPKKMEWTNTRKKSTKSRKSIKSSKVILFPHKLGQSRAGINKTPEYLTRYIKNDIIHMKLTNNFYKNIQILYDINAEINTVKNARKINIGGDHSMAFATIADTLNKHPQAKVIYFDAHGDINTFKASKSKHYHGMPLSYLTGLDKDDRFPIKNLLPFENLLYIGLRCLDPYERKVIYDNNIKYIDSDEINKYPAIVIEKIDGFIQNDPVHVSFDVDCMDPTYIPSTGTYVKNGIQLNAAKKVLDYLHKKNVVNVDITELNIGLGSKKDVDKSVKNTLKLFRTWLN